MGSQNQLGYHHLPKQFDPGINQNFTSSLPINHKPMEPFLMVDESIKTNKLIDFTYQITDQSGEIVERVDLPLNYVHGANSGMLATLENALYGKKAGNSISITVQPEEAFGEWDAALTYTDVLENVPPDFHNIGAEVEMKNDIGETRIFRVSEIAGNTLTFDGNHPLAGKTLVFTINVLGIRDATPEEIRAGRGAETPSMLH